MKELSKTNRLTIAVVAIILVFIAGLLTLRKPEIKYMLNPVQCIGLLKDSSNYVSPEKALAILAQNDGRTVFIDVRNSIDFGRGHVKDAYNIPVRELFFKYNLTFLKELEKGGQTALLYGETPQQANGPWMMLRQTGLNKALVLNGAYNQLNTAVADSLKSKLNLFSEKPLIDTAALKKLSTATLPAGEKPAATATPVKKIAQPVKVEPSKGGGC